MDEKQAHRPSPHHTVEISVNSKPVTMKGSEATGQQIKQAAIEQGVQIQPSFVLQLELPNGSSKVMSAPKSRFTNLKSGKLMESGKRERLAERLRTEAVPKMVEASRRREELAADVRYRTPSQSASARSAAAALARRKKRA